MEAIMVEQPTMSMNFYVNSSPLQGKEGKYITSRNIKERLDRELEVNVGMKVESGLSSDYFTVSDEVSCIFLFWLKRCDEKVTNSQLENRT